MAGILEDVRYALRTLGKNRGFAVLAILSLALGIGANTTVFSLVSAILFRPLPVNDIDRLVVMYTQDPKIPGMLPQSYPNFQDYSRQNAAFSSMAVYFTVGQAMTGRGEPVPLMCQLASGTYFPTLGVQPAFGRFFGPDEDSAPGAHPVVVLSHGFWNRHFAGDPGAVGKTIHISGWPYTIIGIAPPGFHGLNSLIIADLWAPAMMYTRLLPNQSWFNSRRILLFTSVGRLGPGVTLPQAEAELKGRAVELAQRFPRENQNRTVRLVPLAQATISPSQRDNLTRAGAVLMAIAGLVLLIACANVANLQLVRATGRAREIAIRVALGAGRHRIMRQLFVESVILSVAGGAAGILLARLTRDYIWAARPPMLRSLDFQIPLDTRVLLFTLVVSVVAGIVFGLAPAIRISRPDLNADLKDRAGIAPPSGRLNARSTLVVMQVALSLVALVGAGLFLRSLGEAQRTDLGFKVENLAILQFNLASQGYDEARGRQFIREISERVSALPGVSSVGVSGLPPFAGGFQRSVQIDGREEGPGRLTLASPAMPGYLKTMGIGLLRGRDFAPTDLPGSTRVAIVNEIMASRYWPGEDPIGRRFRFFGDEMPYEVVGVARTATYLEIGEQPRPNVYTCMLQNYSPMVAVHARVTGNENGQLATMRREFRALDPNLYVEASTMSRSVLEALWGPRLAAGLLVVFGFLALVLTAVGLHGVIGHTVQLRTRELGIRMAIGATPGGVVRMIVLEGVKLVALGIGIGAAIAGLVSRVVRSMLFGLSPTDVSTFIAVPMLLIVVAVFACWMPARRATRIDPLQALHSD